MKYLLLLTLAACAKPIDAPPPTPDSEIQFVQGEPEPIVIPWTTVTIGWNEHPQVVCGFKLYISQNPLDYSNARIVDIPYPATRVKVSNLVSGERYWAKMTAYNTQGESGFSNEINFVPAFIIPINEFRLEQFVDDGVQKMGIAGPEMLLEANGVFVEWSDDLKTWQRLDVEWSYAHNFHSFTMPYLGPRAFFRIGMERGVKK